MFDYRGEVCINLVNLSDKSSVIEDGERICQMDISKHEKAEWEDVDILLESKRIWRIWSYWKKIIMKQYKIGYIF